MKHVLQRGSILSGLRATESLLGFIFILLIAKTFGATPETDAFFAASVLALGICQLVPTIISQLLVPTLVGETLQQSERIILLRSMWSIILVTGTLLCALAVFFPVLPLRIGAIAIQGETYHHAIQYMQVLAPVFPLTLFFGLLQGMLHAERKFYRVEIAMVVWKILPVIYLLLSPHPVMIYLAAIFSLAAFLRLLIVLVGFPFKHYIHLIPLKPQKKHFPMFFHTLVKTQGLIVATDWLLEVSLRSIASLLPVGGLTVFNYADRFCRTLPSQILRGFGIALLPDMTTACKKGGTEEKKLLTKALLYVIVGGGLLCLCMFVGAPFLATIFIQLSSIPATVLNSLTKCVQAFAPCIVFMLMSMIVQARFFLLAQRRIIVACNAIQIAILFATWFSFQDPTAETLSLCLTTAIGCKTVYGLYVTHKNMLEAT